MPTRWIRVQDTRTGDILPNPVPAEFLDRFDFLKETPSSRKTDVTEPSQPPAEVPVTEPESPKANSGQTITEPAKPEKK